MKEKIKKFFRKFYQKIDWILIIVGSFMVSYGVVDLISSYSYRSFSISSDTIATGIALLVLGILIYKEKAKK